MIIGYLRVSTCKQHLANQQDEIRRFAESRDLKVDVWVNEIVSGKKREQERRLGNLLRRMKRGDTLIVTEMSRLSRSMTDLMAIMGKCLRKGIKLYTTKEKYSFDDSINSKVLCFAFGLVAEIERNLISMRTREALALRKAEGMVLGCGKLYENEYSDSEPVRRHRNAWQGTIHRGDLPALRPVAGYVCQVQDEIPVRAEGIGEKRAATDVENRRKRCPKACGRTWTGRIGVFGRESVYMLVKPFVFSCKYIKDRKNKQNRS
jgi:DNA invertase Pin-like site-specific DNA recombinase